MVRHGETWDETWKMNKSWFLFQRGIILGENIKPSHLAIGFSSVQADLWWARAVGRKVLKDID